MPTIAWGEEVSGVRFGLETPAGEVEAGGTIALGLVCENLSHAPQEIFGFRPGYPRSLRVSPPKPGRPHIRVSFGDLNVLHPPEAFARIMPRTRITTRLDLSFAFDRRGAGRWPVAFAYEPVRSSGRLVSWAPRAGREAQTEIVHLDVTTAKSLERAGIDAAAEERLDDALLSGSSEVVSQLKALGDAGATFAARRVARILSSGGESTIGWRALDALALLGEPGLQALREAREQLPHAYAALSYAEDWLDHRRGESATSEHLPFVTMLERIVAQPDQRGNFLLSWTAVDSPVHGTRRLQLLGSGERIVVHRAPGETTPTTRRLALGAMPMQAVVEALRYSAVWLLRPLREQGLPDEPRPALEVQLALGDPFVRTVAMWNGEWRLGPASALASLLDRLADTSPQGQSSLPPRP